MNDQEAANTMMEGFNYVCNLSRLIAMMPIEDWIKALDHSESVGFFIDPTLYKKYIFSKKPEVLKKILWAALELKRTVQEVQPDVIAVMKEEAGAKK